MFYEESEALVGNEISDEFNFKFILDKEKLHCDIKFIEDIVWYEYDQDSMHTLNDILKENVISLISQSLHIQEENFKGDALEAEILYENGVFKKFILLYANEVIKLKCESLLQIKYEVEKIISSWGKRIKFHSCESDYFTIENDHHKIILITREN